MQAAVQAFKYPSNHRRSAAETRPWASLTDHLADIKNGLRLTVRLYN